MRLSIIKPKNPSRSLRTNQGGLNELCCITRNLQPKFFATVCVPAVYCQTWLLLDLLLLGTLRRCDRAPACYKKVDVSARVVVLSVLILSLQCLPHRLSC